MINTALDCSIRIYIACKYRKSLFLLGDGTDAERQEAFRNIESEFNDACGTTFDGLDLMKAAIFKEADIICVEKLIMVQRVAIEHLQTVHEAGLKELCSYGYNLTYDGDNKKFLKELKAIENQEKLKRVKLLALQQQIDKRNASIPADTVLENTFISNINALKKPPYSNVINMNETSVLELARMINDAQSYTQSANANPN